jgi:2-iminobutanoate/2-iminopropanoate deaminase
MKEIYFPGVPKPKGHYAPAIIHNDLVYVSGQLPLDEKGEAQLGTIEEQTALCLKNLETVLRLSGTDMNHIVKVSVFIADISNWARFNDTYAKIMGDHRPARVVVPCGLLNRGCEIEIDCIAALPQ